MHVLKQVLPTLLCLQAEVKTKKQKYTFQNVEPLWAPVQPNTMNNTPKSGADDISMLLDDSLPDIFTLKS